MAPIQVNKEEKKMKIVEAAMSVFMEKGLQKTRMEDISQECNIAKGSLYHYFKTKDELILGVFQGCNSQMDGEIEAALEGIEDPLEQIYATLDAIADSSLAKSPNYLRMTFELWTEVMQKSDLEKQTIQGFQEFFDQFQNFLIDLLEKSIQEKQLKMHDTKLSSRTMMAILDGTFYHCVALGVQAELKQRLRDSIHFFLDQLTQKI